MTHPRLASLAGLLAALLVTLAPGCATPKQPFSVTEAAADAAAQDDMVKRLAEQQAAPNGINPDLLMNSLERLQLSWQSEQRKGRSRHLEVVLTQKVLPNFDAVAEMFLEGIHDRKLVAAWALGFTRVPDNDLGVVSRHADAVAVLSPGLELLPDDVMANALLALWKIGDSQTPLRPVLDIAAHHHAPEVRSNAMLTLSVILTEDTADLAIDTVLLALEDSEDKVRLHAAAVARRHPAPVYTERLESLLPAEQTPLVRASIAAALGAAGQTSSGQVLLPLLSSPRGIESVHALQALKDIYGRDLGPDPDAWREVVSGG